MAILYGLCSRGRLASLRIESIMHLIMSNRCLFVILVSNCGRVSSAHQSSIPSPSPPLPSSPPSSPPHQPHSISTVSSFVYTQICVFGNQLVLLIIAILVLVRKFFGGSIFASASYTLCISFEALLALHTYLCHMVGLSSRTNRSSRALQERMNLGCERSVGGMATYP